MDFGLAQLILLAIIGVFSVFLGGSVYLNNPKKSLNKWFGITSILLFLWVFFAHFASRSASEDFAVIFYRLNLAVVALFLFSFYSFLVTCFAGIKNKIIEVFIFVVSIIFFKLSLFTEYVVEGVLLKEWGAELIYGTLGSPYKIFSFVVVSIIIYQLFRYYSEANQDKKSKIQYFLVGIILFVIFNTIFNIFVPLFLDTLRYQHLGDFSAIFLLGFTAYAITKKDLFDVKILITSIFVFLITVLLVVDLIVFTNIFWLQVSKGFIVLFFLGFAKFLIKSVTKEVERREELEKLSDQLVETNIKLKKANKKLKKLDKAKSEFISIASHQLRTPLTAIKGYLSMVVEGSYGDVPEEAKGKMEDVLGSSERLISLVNDLLNVSRIESGKIEMDFENVKIIDFINQSIKELKIVAEKEGLYLQLNSEVDENQSVELDESRMRQVVLNIIDNAIKYTEEGGITINLKNQKMESGCDSVLIEISDTGEGMTQKDIENIFDSFSRGSAGDLMHTEGAGLGLYIAKKFVDMHNGSIWIESKGKGEGTSFLIELPVKQL